MIVAIALIVSLIGCASAVDPSTTLEELALPYISEYGLPEHSYKTTEGDVAWLEWWWWKQGVAVFFRYDSVEWSLVGEYRFEPMT